MLAYFLEIGGLAIGFMMGVFYSNTLNKRKSEK